MPCCVLGYPHPGEFFVTDRQMERARDTYAAWKKGFHRVDLTYDLARCSSMVCSNHAFGVLKPHLGPLLSKGTDKERRMVRAELIHDVLWITRTHELCPKDEAP